MSVSVSMIVRNSSDVLERCLISVKDADEIVIVDTGSNDNTIEIAKKYTDKVYEYYGCNEDGKRDGLFENFADARNYSLSKCTGNYVLTIDADEVLSDGSMEKLQAFTGVSMSVKCIAADTGEFHYQPRLCVQNKNIYWKGWAHNYLLCPPGNQSDVYITYYSNQQRAADKNRTLRILTRYLKKYPNSPREMYYLAKEYHKRGRYKDAVKILKKYVKLSTYIPEKADAFVIMSRSYAGLDDRRNATNAVMAAINLNPDMKEALLLAGDLSGDVTRLKYQHIAQAATDTGVIFTRPMKRIKVTVLSKYDWAGSGYNMVRSIRNASGGKIDIEALTEYEGQGSKSFFIKTGVSVRRVGESVAATRIQNSDIIHFKGDWAFNGEFAGIKLPEVKIIYTTSGEAFRILDDVSMFNGDFLSVMTPDLLRDGWYHMPHCWNDFFYTWKKGRKFIVTHNPSNMFRKGTMYINKIMSDITSKRKDVEYICKTNISYNDSIQLKKNSHVYIDQFSYPIYANASIEAMSMGVPVVSKLDPSLYNPRPAVHTIHPKDNITEWVDFVNSLLSWNVLKQASEQAYEYVKKVHGNMGNRWIDIYEHLLAK